MTKERSCRVCGCTEDNACEGGCSWVAADICSNPHCVATAIARMNRALRKIVDQCERIHFERWLRQPLEPADHHVRPDATMAHDHNCFQAAFDSYQAMSLAHDRVSFFLFVAPSHEDVKDDRHFLGNTAFGGVVLRALIASVTNGHEPNGCEHCDRVALALKAADAVFVRAMIGAPGC